MDVSASRPVVALVSGGARSGKSAVAEQLVARLAGDAPVAYLAASPAPPGDPDWERRVERHRARRPPGWRTVELAPGTDLAAALGRERGPVLVESLGTWLAGRPGFDGSPAALCAALRFRPAPTVLVAEEVGWGVHPETAAGRAFRDALGELAQRIGEVADLVVLVAAGRALLLEPAAEVVARAAARALGEPGA